MKRFLHLAFFVVSVALAACSHSPNLSSSQKGEVINLIQPSVSKAEKEERPERKSLGNTARHFSNGRVEVFSLGDVLDRPAVEIFDPERVKTSKKEEKDLFYREKEEEQRVLSSSLYLDQETIPTQPLESKGIDLKPPQGKFSSSDPSVEVFPLSGSSLRVSSVLSPSSIEERPPLYEEKKLNQAPLKDPKYTKKHPIYVYFDHNSNFLGKDAEQTLLALAQSYKDSGAKTPVFVEGHASKQAAFQDDIRRKTVNLKISMDRAYAVAKVLIEAGIPAEVLETKAYGESRSPLFLHEGLSKEAAARRVEIIGLQ